MTVAVPYKRNETKRYRVLSSVHCPTSLYSFYSARVVNESVGRIYCTYFFPICFSQVTTFARWVVIIRERERERGCKVPKWSSARKATAKATGKTAKAEGEWCENKKCSLILSDIWGYSLISNPISLSQSQHTPHWSFSILYTDTHNKEKEKLRFPFTILFHPLPLSHIWSNILL